MEEHETNNEPGWNLVVDPGNSGVRLDRFISTRIPRLSRARAARLHVVDLDDPSLILKKSSTVREGQRLWVSRPVPDQGIEYPEPKVLIDTNEYVVLDKPAGVAVHPSASRFLGTVTHWLGRDPHFGDTKPAHRLDVETSGVLVCTRPPTEFEMGRVFAEHRAKKTYLAVIEGTPSLDEWTMSTPLGFDPDSRIKLKMSEGDLPAETRFVVRERGPDRTLVEAHPITGRQHQIRVHLHMSGHRVVGDKLYGVSEELFIESRSRPLTSAEVVTLGHHRHALHAWKIELPLTSGRLVCECPLPRELGGLVGVS